MNENSGTQIEVIYPMERQPSPMTPMMMLTHAVERGADVTVLEKLMALSERYEANQARRAFDEAIAAAKSKIPRIIKNRQGHNSKAYADFAAIAKAVDPILAEFGLSYRFRTKQDERIHVTCIISHKAGHAEENTLAGPADTSGSKNTIQAIGSTLTYLQRYSLVQALGLASSDDDDGNAGGTTTITDEQVTEIAALIEDVQADKAGFLKYIGVSALTDIPAKQFQRAIDALNTKRRAKS